MRMIRIAWREALRRFRVLRCLGCRADSENVFDWYVNELRDGPYCPECAGKLANIGHTGRSLHQFYQTTHG